MTQPAAEQLLNLADRAERHGLTPDEAARLRDGINALTAELATMTHVAKGNKAHVAAIVPDLEAATQRAERAEAALASFRDRVQAITDEARGGIRQQLGDVLAALDEHQEQPATAAPEQPVRAPDGTPLCTCTYGKRCPACRD